MNFSSTCLISEKGFSLSVVKNLTLIKNKMKNNNKNTNTATAASWAAVCSKRSLVAPALSPHTIRHRRLCPLWRDEPVMPACQAKAATPRRLVST
ncbi:MAG: hypothetical protein IJ993_05705, partial [Akkermansia sp.]|nr:hypothetical protein [Akkermansia sp.]